MNSSSSEKRLAMETVLRGEATVRDFISSHFERRVAPCGPVGFVGVPRSVFRGVLRACRRLTRLAPGGFQPATRSALPAGGFGDEFSWQRLTVTYFYPWGYFYPVCSGAAAVASRQLEYFRRRGHRVRMMLRAAPYRGRSAFERYYHWVDDMAVVDVGSYPEAQRCFDRWDLGSYLAGHAELAAEPEISKWLSEPCDVAFVNYVFATPLLDVLPAKAYRVLEACDVMSHQFLGHGGPSDVLEHSLASEFDLYRLYDSVLMINPEEQRCARAHGAVNSIYMPPALAMAPETGERVGREEYDLLFVGSDHLPNVEGVNWFYDNVFRPLLKPQGIRWAICGSVCRALRFRDTAVSRLGRVTDVARLYASSKVVVVPLFRGSGISIKTLEALGHRKPVVTTPCGRRGLPASADDPLLSLPFDDDPAAVAGAILRLCSSGIAREDYGRRGAAYVGKHFSARAYGRRMDEIFSRVAARTSAEPGEFASRCVREREAVSELR